MFYFISAPFRANISIGTEDSLFTGGGGGGVLVNGQGPQPSPYQGQGYGGGGNGYNSYGDGMPGVILIEIN